VELLKVTKEAETNTVLAEVLKHPISPPLKGLLQFCHNCQLRAVYEKQLRQQLGLSDSDPVSIPAPGVPESTADLALSFGNDESSSGASNEFYDPSKEENGEGDDWADSFVTDQEVQEQKERDRRNK